MKLEINRRASSGKRTKHMDVRYLFIHGKVKDGDFNIEHCPTDEMIGDFSTKPLHGRKFQYSRALIIGFDMKSSDGKKVTWSNFVTVKMLRLSSPRSVLEDTQ